MSGFGIMSHVFGKEQTIEYNVNNRSSRGLFI